MIHWFGWIGFGVGDQYSFAIRVYGYGTLNQTMFNKGNVRAIAPQF